MPDWKKLLDEGAKLARDGLRDAGEGIKQAADGARKVAGIGVGAIRIKAQKRGYRGHDYKGIVILELSEPVEAEKLTVTLWAKQGRLQTGGGSTTETVVRRSIQLAGAQTYEGGEYRFSILVPAEIELPEDDGFAGYVAKAVKVAKAVRTFTDGELKWSLEATLHIPWKRNLSKTVDIDVGEGESPGRSEPPPPRREPPPRAEPDLDVTQPDLEDVEETSANPVDEVVTYPRPVPLPGGWTPALDACLRELERRGWVAVHLRRAPGVSPSVVGEVLSRHPDLDPDVLHFYSEMDGLSVVIGKALHGTADRTKRAVDEWTARKQGWLGGLQTLGGMPQMREAAIAEFGPDFEETMRELEIPDLARLMDDGTEDFMSRDGRTVIFGGITLGYGVDFGITRADEIRAWRHPPPGQPGREGYYDFMADTYQAELARREADRPSRWYALQGEDHCAGLMEPAALYRWPELLQLCLDHLGR